MKIIDIYPIPDDCCVVTKSFVENLSSGLQQSKRFRICVA